MRLQVIDPKANFSCDGCTNCCTQPYAVIIEEEKARALTSEEQRILEALQSEKYTLRTLGGIAGHAHIARKFLRPLVQGLVDEGIAHEITQADGKHLWGITPFGRRIWRASTGGSVQPSDTPDGPS